MKKTVTSLLLCSSLVAALTACSSEKQTVGAKVRLKLSEQMATDELTDAGEQLMTPETLHLADRAFTLALEKNPNDKKAQFYHVFLKRFMVFRGVMTNIQPAMKKYATAEKYAEYEKNIKSGETPLRRFLIAPKDGVPTPIYNEEDAQNLLVQYRNALVEFRQFVSANPDLQLDLSLNPYVFQEQIQKRLPDTCTIIEGKSEEDTTVVCDPDKARTVHVNIADLMALKQEAAGEILYITFYTSYNVRGLVDASKALESAAQNQSLTKQQQMDLVTSKMDLGLMKNQGFTAIRSLAADYGVAVKWAMKYQDSLCPKDKNGQPAKRKGSMFESGLCIDDASNMQKNLALLEQILKGKMAVQLGNSAEGTAPVTKNFNFMALFDSPVKNLKALMPSAWSADGSTATALKDKTFGGLMPDGDADSLLRKDTASTTQQK